MAPKDNCAKYQYVITPSGPKILPVADEESKDEESPAEYNAGGYLPVRVDDSFKDGRYRVIRKLGWGHFSTVWLVKDNFTNNHSALKVVKSAGRYAETARDEIKLLSKIAQGSLTHPGRYHIVSFLDSFAHTSIEASHICIVFEPLGENLLALVERHKKKGVPRALVKVIAKQILLGLSYLHDQCDLVHTDIKPENILVSIPDIESHINFELTRCPSPTSRRVGVPLPVKTRAGGVSIPAARTTRRQVQIFDSQPLSSPGRAPVSGSKTSSNSASIGSVKHHSRVPSSGGNSVMSPLSTVPAPLSKSTQPARAISPTSTASSVSLSSLSISSTTVASTPATSVSHGSIPSAVGKIKPLDEVHREPNGKSIPVPVRSEAVPTSNGHERSDAAKANTLTMPGSSPLFSWNDLTMKSLTYPICDSPRPAPGKIKPSPPTSLRKQVLSSSPFSSLRNDPTAWLVGGGATLAPAVLVSASVSISSAGADVVVLPNGELGTDDLDTVKSNVNGAVPSLLTQTAPRDRSDLTSSPLPRQSHTPIATCSDTTPTNQMSPSASPPPTPPAPTAIYPLTEPPLCTSPEPLPPICIKIADLGNATPSTKHFTEDIQTRQYRSPEAIVGRKDWDARVDVWSLACLVFELLTAEYLFDPHGQGELFTKDDDHMAQIIELMGDSPLDAKMGGKYSRELFDHTGALRYIRTLKPWPLKRVMMEKYLFTEVDATALCKFLEPMLVVDMRERKKASEMIDHAWLTVTDADGEIGEW